MAPTQTYANHAHQPRAARVAFLFWVLALAAFALRWFQIGGRYSMAAGIGSLLASVLVLIAISRLYIVALQDRIIRLEMRLRTAALLTPVQQQLYAALSTKQVVALRFASDAELPLLVERAARENLKPDQIKRAITNWVADWQRT